MQACLVVSSGQRIKCSLHICWQFQDGIIYRQPPSLRCAVLIPGAWTFCNVQYMTQYKLAHLELSVPFQSWRTMPICLHYAFGTCAHKYCLTWNAYIDTCCYDYNAYHSAVKSNFSPLMTAVSYDAIASVHVLPERPYCCVKFPGRKGSYVTPGTGHSRPERDAINSSVRQCDVVCVCVCVCVCVFQPHVISVSKFTDSSYLWQKIK